MTTVLPSQAVRTDKMHNAFRFGATSSRTSANFSCVTTFVPKAMQAAPETSLAREQVLRCIGRNVVNFQYLEATLRSIIPSLSNDGTMTDWNANIGAKTRKHKKSSLGNLAESFLGDIFPRPAERQSDTSESADENIVRFSFTIEATADEALSRRRALQKLVIERNRLIHRDVLGIDLNAPDQCLQFLEFLDEQNERIRAQLDFLSALRKAHRTAVEEFVRFISTDEFMSALRGDQGSAQRDENSDAGS